MESRMREIRTYGLTRGKPHRRQRRGVGLYSTNKVSLKREKRFGGARTDSSKQEGVGRRSFLNVLERVRVKPRKLEL